MKNKYVLQSVILLVGVICSLQLFSQNSPLGDRGIDFVILDDYIINDELAGDLQQRQKSNVATNSSGEFVVVWSDERNGEFDIFAQMYNPDGSKKGNNFRINDDANDLEDTDPDVAINDDGQFVVTWQGRRWNDIRVFARKFNADGSPAAASVLVSTDEESPHALMPNVAMNNSGDFVVAWNDDRDGEYVVYTQLYHWDGSSGSGNTLVNTEGETEYGIIPPGVAMNEEGGFVVCWADNRKIWSNILAQKFNKMGTKIGGNFYVNDQVACDSSAQLRPTISMNKSGEFVICWDDRRGGLWGQGDPNIWAQRFNSNGDMAGENFLITDFEGEKYAKQMDISINNSGKFVISWYEDTDDWWGDVYGQCFNANGSPVADHFRIDDWDGQGVQEFPSVGLNENNEFVFTFCDDHGDSRVTAIRYNWNGEVIQNSWTVNDDVAAVKQNYPATDINENGEWVTVWQDDRDDLFNDIFSQKYDKNGNPIGENLKLNDDPYSVVVQEYADVAINNDGEYVGVWLDQRSPVFQGVYMRFVASHNKGEGTNIKVNDDDGGWKSSPAVDMDGEGNFIVVWEDDRNGFADIYAQRYTSDGTPIGANYQVNEPHNRHQRSPDIAMNSSGRHVIVWSDEKVPPRRTFARIFEADGTPVGESFDCSGYTENSFQSVPVVATDDAGNFVVAWQDERNYWTNGDAYDIYGRLFNADGTPQINEFKVHDDNTLRKQIMPSVTMSPDGEEALIMWTDYRKENGNPDIWAQKFINGEPEEKGNRMINKPDAFYYNHQRSFSHAVAANNDRVTYAFLDNRRHKHWDSNGKLTDWELVDIEEQLVTKDFVIYPNPASGRISLQSAVFDQQTSVVQVYDLNGKKLLEQNIPKGTTTAEINANILANGIYSCRVISENKSSTQKLIIQK